MNKSITYGCLLLILAITSCRETKSPEQTIFPDRVEVRSMKTNIDKENLSRIEALNVLDSVLVVYDEFLGQKCTLFDLEDSTNWFRFGTIGQGPNELTNPSVIISYDQGLQVFDQFSGAIYNYDVKALRVNRDTTLLCYFKGDKGNFKDVFYSKLVGAADSLLFGAGVIDGKFQYNLFDMQGNSYHKAIEIYNAQDQFFNKYQKLLSNQGCLVKRNNCDQFVFALKNSSNIDFIRINNKKIEVSNAYHERNPQMVPKQQGEHNFSIPAAESPIGYISLTGGDSCVYALHTTNLYKSARYCSSEVRVYDWEGNPIKILALDREAYHISVDSSDNKLYAAVKDEDGGWNIVYYDT